jgi:hypothetical protein
MESNIRLEKIKEVNEKEEEGEPSQVPELSKVPHKRIVVKNSPLSFFCALSAYKEKHRYDKINSSNLKNSNNSKD